MSSSQQLLLGEGAGGAAPVYIEDVFSTWLYTGTDATLAIPNGIDLSTKGGLVWIKNRSTNSSFGGSHQLVDTVRGLTATSGSSMLSTNNADSSSGTNGYSASTQGFSSFDTTGFTVKSSGGEVYSGACNTSGVRYTSWTFREQPKFFDIVTYTGNGAAGRQISHNLGSTPGCIIVKTATGGNGWNVWHTALGGNDKEILLNSTNASTSFGYFGGAPTSTTFTVDGAVGNGTNTNGQLFVAYIFAHNAGGFGAAGTDNVISCGSMTISGSDTTVTLGYEPQWLLVKRTSNTGNWILWDVMRGLPVGGSGMGLFPNTSGVEEAAGGANLSATGFTIPSGQLGTGDYIYIAIRRGPMKVPTSGTSVFSPLALSNTTGTKNTTGFPVDLQINAERNGVHNTFVVDRLRGVITNNTDTASPYLKTNATSAEATDITALTRYWDNTGFMTASWQNGAGTAYWNFGRAPGFFDEVCYMGTGVTTNFTHNLGVVPDMIITKKRSNTGPWSVYTSATGNTDYLELNTNNAVATNTSYYNSTTPTASVFTLGSSTSTNTSSQTYVAYLFATCAGVSKVGSYVGTGTTNQIDCGFTGGARFVMIKRTDNYNADVGNWYVWDSARGIVSGNDPYLFINSTAAEVTNTDYIDPYSAGFEISSTAPNGINQSSANYIFLAIA